MLEEAASIEWSEDYAFLRERARAHLASADAAPHPAGNVRVLSPRGREDVGVATIERERPAGGRRFARDQAADPTLPAEPRRSAHHDAADPELPAEQRRFARAYD